MAKTSRKQLWWITVGSTVALIIVILVLRTWADLRLISTGNEKLLPITGFQDKMTRLSGAAPTGETAPVWEKGVPTMGDEAAPAELIEFADFGCPFSKGEAPILRALFVKYPGFFRLQFRNFPIVDLHPGADRAAAAGVCADAQGKFWAMHDVLFANQGNFSEADLAKYAGDAGLNGAQFKKCMASPDTAKKVNDDIAAGKAAGVAGTPTFFVSIGSGAPVKMEGAYPIEVWEKIPAFFATK
jgi:protein-disulfide isomerase